MIVLTFHWASFLIKRGSHLKGIFFTSLEGCLLYLRIKEKDGNRIGLGCSLTLLEFLHSEKVASEYNNQNLCQKLGLKSGKDGISISVKLSDFEAFITLAFGTLYVGSLGKNEVFEGA